MRKSLAIAAMVLVAGLLLVAAYDMAVNILWVGGFTLTVTVNAADDPPATIACVPIGRRKDALVAADAYPELGRRVVEGMSNEVPFDGQPLLVSVKTTGRDSGFGRSLHYTQEEALLLVAEWPGGRRAVKVVDIPDGRDRAARAVTVTVP